MLHCVADEVFGAQIREGATSVENSLIPRLINVPELVRTGLHRALIRRRIVWSSRCTCASHSVGTACSDRTARSASNRTWRHQTPVNAVNKVPDYNDRTYAEDVFSVE